MAVAPYVTGAMERYQLHAISIVPTNPMITILRLIFYIGKRASRCTLRCSTVCPCSSSNPDIPNVYQTRDHILRYCPLFEKDQDQYLRPTFLRINNPKWPIYDLFHKDKIQHLLSFLQHSHAFTKAFAPRIPDPPPPNFRDPS